MGVRALLAPAPAAALIPDPGGPFTVSKPKTDGFALPLRGPLYERFGYDRGRLHSGIDVAVLGTNAVHAAQSGVVTAVGYLDGYAGYGHVVRIRHPGRATTLYAHLASASVRVGEHVERGELIARAGCTGSCTGPHLHFELRIAGRLVDPLKFLPRGLR